MTKVRQRSSISALIIFAREPKVGTVKTRLCQILPASFVTELYACFLKDLFSFTAAVNVDKRFLFYAADSGSIDFLRANADGFQLLRQAGGSLGDRMRSAFERVFKGGAGKALIIGTDCLSLTTRDFKQALAALDDHDGVVGPSLDGGYYLLGMKQLLPEIFQGIEWSSSRVLSQTLKAAKRKRWSTFLLREQEDIDTMDAFKRLAADRNLLKRLPVTREFLKKTQPVWKAL